MSFTIRFCDIVLEQYLQILIIKLGEFARGMLGVKDLIPLIIFPILLINKNLLYSLALREETLLSLNFEVVFLKL